MASYFGPSGGERLCTSIEIGNEPGSKFDRALFRMIFKQMALGIRDGDPRVKILTPAVQARPGDDYSQDLRGLYAEKDILPLYDVINLNFYDDADEPSFHGCSGLTRKFVPKMSFWAVKQLYELLGNCRLNRIVTKNPGDLFVYEFEDGDNPKRLIWVAWSPTGTRTDQRDGHVPHEMKVTLSGLPSLPSRVIGMATTDSAPPQPAWEKANSSSITLSIGESPIYLIMKHTASGN